MTTCARWGSWLLVLAAGCVHFPPSRTLVSLEPETPLVIHDVNVFSGTSNGETPHQDVQVRGGRIESVVATQPGSAYPGARLIEGAGKTLLPGFVDVHAHPTGTGAPFYRLEVPDPTRNLQAHLFVGVTTIYDPGGNPEQLGKLARDLDAGALLGPRLYYAGKMITAKDGYPDSMLRELLPWPLAGLASADFALQVSNPDEARAAVHRNLKDGASFVKVAVSLLPNDQTPRLDAAELSAVVEEAHAQHKKVVAHVDSADDALLCARAGVDGLWHDVQLDLLTSDQVHEISAKVPVVVPTLTTFDGFDSLYTGEVNPSALLRNTESPGLIQSLVDAPQHVHDIPPSLRVWMNRLHANHAGRRANAAALHAAGMTVLVGTDANGADGSFPANYPAELLALREAGIDSGDILLGATSRAAHFIDSNPDFGTIEPGKVADLVLVEGDPLVDFAAATHVATVIARGRVVVRHPGYDQPD